MNRKIIISILSILFITLLILIINDKTIEIDNIIHQLIANTIMNKKVTELMKIITVFASQYVIIPLVLIIFIVISYKEAKLNPNILYLTMITFITNQSIKFIIKRPRPININILIEKGYSFPSAHAMISTVVYGYIIYKINKTDLKYKNIINIFLIIFILLISLSRIYLGVHYFSDVISGIILSLIILLIYQEINKKTIKSK